MRNNSLHGFLIPKVNAAAAAGYTPKFRPADRSMPEWNEGFGFVETNKKDNNEERFPGSKNKVGGREVR